MKMSDSLCSSPLDGNESFDYDDPYYGGKASRGEGEHAI